MTNLIMRINYVDATKPYSGAGSVPADYIAMDLVNDYIIWTEGDTVVTDLMTHEPTHTELNNASVIIDEYADHDVPLVLLMDYSHDVGGAYYTHKIIGIGEDMQYVFNFSFDGATANEPQLEAWDSSAHSTVIKNVLGAGIPANSMVKAICTTGTTPGAGWTGTAIAGATASRVIKLNATLGALTIAKNLYANIKITVPMAYATPAVETFVLTVRYSWQ